MRSIWRFLQIRSTSCITAGLKKFDLAGDDNPVRSDSVNRKFTDNRFEFVRGSKYLHP